MPFDTYILVAYSTAGWSWSFEVKQSAKTHNQKSHWYDLIFWWCQHKVGSSENICAYSYLFWYWQLRMVKKSCQGLTLDLQPFFWVKLDLAEVCENGIFHNVGFLIRRSSSCWEYGSWILGQWYHCFTGSRRRAAETWLRDVNKTPQKIDMNTCNQPLSGLPTSVGLKHGKT